MTFMPTCAACGGYAVPLAYIKSCGWPERAISLADGTALGSPVMGREALYDGKQASAGAHAWTNVQLLTRCNS